jgi:hypothetical protein
MQNVLFCMVCRPFFFYRKFSIKICFAMLDLMTSFVVCSVCALFFAQALSLLTHMWNRSWAMRFSLLPLWIRFIR